MVHVYSEEDPGHGFERVAPDLEDVYFSTMAGYISRGAEQKGEEVVI